MNISPVFYKSTDFLFFKREVGDIAMEVIVMIGLHCQQSRSPDIRIRNGAELEIMLNIQDRGEIILSALIEHGLISRTEVDHFYYCDFFVEMNKQLLTNWRNGERTRKAIQSKSKESKSKESNSSQSNSSQSNSSQSNSSQINSTQINSTQLNSTECHASAKAPPKQWGGTALNGVKSPNSRENLHARKNLPNNVSDAVAMPKQCGGNASAMPTVEEVDEKIRSIGYEPKDFTENDRAEFIRSGFAEDYVSF